MPRSLTVKDYIKFITLVFIAFIFLTGINLLFVSGSSPFKIEFLSIKGYFLFELVLILVVSISMLFATKKILQSVSEDINETDQYLQEIEKQNQTLKDLTLLYNNAIENNIKKTEFFSNMSHDLKTPLSVILGAIQLIDHKDVIEASGQKISAKNLQIIKQNCFRLLRLINNILDLTRMDSNNAKLNLTNCNVVYLVEEIAQSVLPYAEQKKIYVEFDTEAEEIITAVDVDKVERIILNLLSNAIKFTSPGGKISINVTYTHDKLYVSVKDTGVGIPQEMQNKIFERFRQVNSPLTRESEGSGIGLSLVQSFIELHGGNISVRSEKNKGSEFIIELPIRLTSESEEICTPVHNTQSKIIEAIRIEFSDIYSLT